MTRHNEHDRRPLFLKLYAETGRVGDSARAVGLNRCTPAQWAAEDPEFAELFKQAREDYVEKLEKEADRRAVEGVPKGVYFQGVRSGEELEFSDNLLKFRLQALAPEKYRDRKTIEHTGPGGGPVVVQHLTDEELERIAAGGG